MPLKTTKFLRDSRVAEQIIPVGVTTATSQTALPFFLFTPGYWFKFAGLGIGNRALAGAVGLSARIVRGNGPLSNPNLRTDASEAEDYETDAFAFVINGTVYNKTAIDGGDFTAAHVVTALKFGVILFQINTSGTVSTKVPAATPTTAMAYATYDEAVSNLPQPDANQAAIGYLVIEADSGNWTANTDDLTTDLEEATWVQGPVTYPGGLSPVLNPLDASVAAVTATYVEGDVTDTASNVIGDASDMIVLMYTSDGTGALTAGTATLRIRPFPLNGQSIPGGYQA